MQETKNGKYIIFVRKGDDSILTIMKHTEEEAENMIRPFLENGTFISCKYKPNYNNFSNRFVRFFISK